MCLCASDRCPTQIIRLVLPLLKTVKYCHAYCTSGDGVIRALELVILVLLYVVFFVCLFSFFLHCSVAPSGFLTSLIFPPHLSGICLMSPALLAEFITSLLSLHTCTASPSLALHSVCSPAFSSQSAPRPVSSVSPLLFLTCASLPHPNLQLIPSLV